jgi:hypothetical protein
MREKDESSTGEYSCLSDDVTITAYVRLGYVTRMVEYVLKQLVIFTVEDT